MVPPYFCLTIVAREQLPIELLKSLTLCERYIAEPPTSRPYCLGNNNLSPTRYHANGPITRTISVTARFVGGGDEVHVDPLASQVFWMGHSVLTRPSPTPTRLPSMEARRPV